MINIFFFSSRRRHTRYWRDWSSDVCSSDLCENFDLARIPYFNQDLEDEGNPEPVKELREKIRAYDAVLIATPEYDYAIPGVLTAALDWALRSRHDPTPFRHKPVGIVGASPGGGGTARGQLVLRQILLHPPAYVMPEPQLLIPFSRQKFDAETGNLVDEETRRSEERRVGKECR